MSFSRMLNIALSMPMIALITYLIASLARISPTPAVTAAISVPISGTDPVFKKVSPALARATTIDKIPATVVFQLFIISFCLSWVRN